tara:strand:+ start:1132 stop:1386 length:255 start_codon:yes stop_codon:yes gene_type:complete
MNTEKLMKELDTCKNEDEMKKVFENHFEDEVEREMMWNLLKKFRDFENQKLTDSDTQDTEQDYMNEIVKVMNDYEQHQKNKKRE